MAASWLYHLGMLVSASAVYFQHCCPSHLDTKRQNDCGSLLSDVSDATEVNDESKTSRKWRKWGLNAFCDYKPQERSECVTCCMHKNTNYAEKYIK